MAPNELLLKPWEQGFELPQTFNMVDLLLERHLKGGGADRIAVICEDQKLTYKQLGQMTNSIGNGLLDLGIQPGDRIIILLYDRPAFMALFLATMKIGAVPVPINMLATPKDLTHFVGDSQAAAIVMESELYPKMADVLEGAAMLKCVILNGDVVPGTISLDHLIEYGNAALDVHPTSKDDPSYWLYTSGTTGSPKGVVHHHKDLVYAVETWGRHIVEFTTEDCVLCVPKLYFSYGLNNALYLPLYHGASVILNPERPLPETVLNLIERHRPTGLFSVPTAYGQALNYLDETGAAPDLSSLRFCVSAGEALPGALFQRWRHRFGVEILDGLGSTEAGFIFICNRPGRVKENASGQPLPGYAVEVRDEGGRPLPPCEVGELWVKSNTLFHNYWNQPEKTADTLVNGWMKTGDMGYLDSENYFYYSARANDTMKVSGIWVSPLEVENTLLGHPAVAECAVVGLEDAMGLIKPKAYIAVKSGHQGDNKLAGELKLYVKERLAPYKYPRTIEFVESLPKTATGKIQRFKLRDSGPDACS